VPRFFSLVRIDAYELFQTLEFAADEDCKKIDKVVEAFERHCIGEINVTYDTCSIDERRNSVIRSIRSCLSCID